jgi:NAD(P)-dependent dehydrogenase (short-subunit alcohol dehydrogenase family)
MRLNGKRIVVIGGGSGIGLETARLALAEGAIATIAGRSEDRLRKAAESLKTPTSDDATDWLRTVVADIAEESSIRSLCDGETRVDPVSRCAIPGSSLVLALIDAGAPAPYVHDSPITRYCRAAGRFVPRFEI